MENLPTPALVVDGAVLRANIERLAAYARGHRLRVRPHTKTHKSVFVASLQVGAGASGLTAAKAGEAEIMATVCEDILVAYPPVDPERCARIAALATHRTVRVALDSITAAQRMAQAAAAAQSRVGVLVDVDVGMGRTGVQTPEEALRLAEVIDRDPSLHLDGIMYYPGHVWSPPEEQHEALQKVATKLEEVIRFWTKGGLKADIVSGGSTPTAYQSHLVPQTTEIRPGTYVFNDMNTVHGGFCTIEDCAARMICTVVSTAIPGQFVIDGGTKTFTSDRCIPRPESGHGYIIEYPEARIFALSEEHGQVDARACSRVPKVGERVTVIPNHICPCVNLQDSFWIAEPGNPLRRITVDARGKLS